MSNLMSGHLLCQIIAVCINVYIVLKKCNAVKSRENLIHRHVCRMNVNLESVEYV